MVSAFQSRETGFGVQINKDELQKINDRRKDTEYFDKVAAKDVLNTTKKTPLTKSPFVQLFEFGGSNGYWTGNHMVVQTEDCIDCLKTIHDGEYQYAFLYDHISGHAKKRAGGLDVSNMNKNWGGQLLRITLLKEKVGYLGPFHDLANPKMVQVGEEQSLWYETPRDLEHGPFHLSSTEQ